jgi:DJ-1/PfpI family
MSVPLSLSERSKPKITTQQLSVGCLIYEQMDQIDLTGPFEVLSRMPDTSILIIGKEVAPIRDVQGLRLSPDASIAEAELFDVLVVPGGYEQQALMHDQEVLALIREHARKEKLLFSVCTGGSAMWCRRRARGKAGDDTLDCTALDASLWRGSCGCKGRGGRQHHQRCRGDSRAGCSPCVGIPSEGRCGCSGNPTCN